MQLKEQLNIARRGEGMENFFCGSTVEVKKTSRKDLLGKVSQLFLLPIVAKCWQGHGFSAFKVNVTLFILSPELTESSLTTSLQGLEGKTLGTRLGLGMCIADDNS